MRVRRILVIGITVLLVLSAAWATASAASEALDPVYLATLANEAKLRTEPDKNATVRRFLKKGDTVTLLSFTDDWYVVSYQNVLGYLDPSEMSGAQLTPSVDIYEWDLEVYRTLGLGDRGVAVRLLQGTLNALGYDAGAVDGIYGRKTYLAVATFQSYQYMTVNGIADEAVQKLLYSGNATPAPAPSYQRPTLSKGSTHPDVAYLQTWLYNLGYLAYEPSGIFDQATEKAVSAFQKDENLTVDGIVGPKTWLRLDAFVAIVQGDQ